MLDLTTRVLSVRLSAEWNETLESLAVAEVEWLSLELEESAARDEETLEEFAWTDCETLVEEALRLLTDTELLRVPLELLKDCWLAKVPLLVASMLLLMVPLGLLKD